MGSSSCCRRSSCSAVSNSGKFSVFCSCRRSRPSSAILHAHFLIDRYGRRPVLFLYYFVGAFFHLWFAHATGLWIYVAIAAVGWGNPGVYGPNGGYVSELFSTPLRAPAGGWVFGICRVGSVLAPAVVCVMLQYGLGAYVLDTLGLTFLIASIALGMVE